MLSWWAAVAVVVMVAVSAPPSARATAPDTYRAVVTIAGNGNPGDTGDGGDARKATVAADLSIDLGPEGQLYLVDRESGTVRTINPDGRIDRVPGTEELTAVDVDSAEGGLYLVTETDLWRVTDGRAVLLFEGLTDATSVAADPAGNVYVADVENSSWGGRIRRITPDGAATVVAGVVDAEDPRSALGAELAFVRGLTIDAQGTVYFVDDEYADGPAVLMLDASGAVREVVRRDTFGSHGTYKPSRYQTSVATGPDEGLAVSADGRVHVLGAAFGVGGVRVVGTGGELAPVGPDVFDPEDIAVHKSGTVYLAARGQVLMLGDDVTDAQDESPDQDRWADQEPGTVLTVAGPMTDPQDRDYVLDGFDTEDIVVGTDGAVHTVENGRVRTLFGSARVSRKLAYLQLHSFEFNVRNIAPAEGGALYVMAEATYLEDTSFHEAPLVLLVHPDKAEVLIMVGGPQFGDIQRTDRVVGTSAAGGRLYVSDEQGRVRALEPDGSLRDLAKKDPYEAFAVDPKGAVYYYDDQRVFRVGQDGRRSQIAGTGSARGESGDGGPARAAPVDGVRDIAFAPDGTVYLATVDGLRAIAVDGTIDTVVPDLVEQIAVDAHGNLYFTESLAVLVLVRPDQATEFPWLFVTAGSAAALLLLAGVGYVIRARRRTAASVHKV